MTSFFDCIEHADAELIESLSKLAYDLRENRKLLLEQYGITEEEILLNKLSNGEIPEHPAYEHYLSALILTQMRDTVRDELTIALKEAKPA